MIARAIERYGGRARWERLRLTLAPTSLRGLIPWMKGAGRTFRLPARADIVPSRAEATFFDASRAPQVAALVAAGRAVFLRVRVVLRLGTVPTPLVALDARLAPPQVNFDA